MTLTTLLVVVPLVGTLAALIAPSRRLVEGVTVVAMTLVLALVLALWGTQTAHLPLASTYLYVDSLSAILLGVIALVAFTASLYSVGHLRDLLPAARISRPSRTSIADSARPFGFWRGLVVGGSGGVRLRRYFVLFNLFVFTMLAAVVVNNLAFMWLAIEGSTLASAFLVSFEETHEAIEAAWKYVIVVSIGLVVALLGTLFLYTAGTNAGVAPAVALNWTALSRAAGSMDPQIVLVAFVFALVGFGTKAGLAPMHTWLPDAHSEAPAPVSALFSAALLPTAVYAILRYTLLAQGSGAGGSAHAWLLGVGLFSVLVATVFLLRQSNYKRAFAYSSIENMGVVVVGVGFGGVLGVTGALLLLVAHAAAKSLLFFTSGNLYAGYRTKDPREITGVLSTFPLTGGSLLVGAFAITGAPLFCVFVSEFHVFQAGFASAPWLAAFLALLLLGVFLTLVWYATSMSFGDATPAEMQRLSSWTIVPLALLIALVVVLGFVVPQPLSGLLAHAAALFDGGASA